MTEAAFITKSSNFDDISLKAILNTLSWILFKLLFIDEGKYYDARVFMGLRNCL